MTQKIKKTNKDDVSTLNYRIVPFETAQNQPFQFVPIRLAQIPEVLFSKRWTNHQTAQQIRFKKCNKRYTGII
jgi:hypothetical protein